jgi:hypothetical protein
MVPRMWVCGQDLQYISAIAIFNFQLLASRHIPADICASEVDGSAFSSLSDCSAAYIDY